MKKIDELIKEAVPSSFVKKAIKLVNESGNGEAKFFIGSIANLKEYDSFFNGFNPNNKYKFKKDNILLFLNQLKIEYIYQSINKYNNVSESYFHGRYTEIYNMDDRELSFNLDYFTDNSRYYIRSNDNIFTVFRKIALPKISNLRIEKFELDDGTYEYHFLLELNTKYNSKDYDASSSEMGTKEDIKLILPHNRILFGAPGTGKSYQLELDRVVFDQNYERVTFYPNYTYSQFVGSYKPKPKLNSEGEEFISYEFVPGPFLRVWIQAVKDLKCSNVINHLLIIEELNRANVAAVFGDVFQLLDRDVYGSSRYGIAFSEDMKKYLKDYHNFTDIELLSMKIPSNMYIWSTMNSADQGVNPVDSAFKRRWNFEYISINNNMEDMSSYYLNLKPYQRINWNELRLRINDRLTELDLNVNEDKLIGPFFLSENELLSVDIDEIFKSKLMMYIFEDVLKHRRGKFFKSELNTLSKIFEAYDREENIFDFDILNNNKGFDEKLDEILEDINSESI